jgi:hypothetical protein
MCNLEYRGWKNSEDQEAISWEVGKPAADAPGFI